MEEFKEICKNPWCKALFTYTKNDFIKTEEGLEHPNQCQKCKSFNGDLSGGVEWEDKKYEGSRNDGMPHPFRYKVTNFRL
jgi:hypothetical protein